jgi:hypothetical protein
MRNCALGMSGPQHSMPQWLKPSAGLLGRRPGLAVRGCALTESPAVAAWSVTALARRAHQKRREAAPVVPCPPCALAARMADVPSGRAALHAGRQAAAVGARKFVFRGGGEDYL